MRIGTVALVIGCSGTLAWGQGELIPNPSFEQATSCPFANGQISLADPWISPTTATTDYFNPCDTTPDNVGVPDNAVGSQEAFEGSSYAGFIAVSPPMGEPNYREYLQTPLFGGALEAGKTYRFAMHLCLAEDSSAATDRVGAYFSTTPVSMGDYFPLPFVPQLETPAGAFLDDYTAWTTFSETFVAAGGEQYVTIGNFHDATGSATIPAGFGPAPPLQVGTGYYYIDVVSLLCEPCTHPPDDMVAWWPLDELSGIVASDIVYALSGLHVGGPTPLPGHVDGGLGFGGASGVVVPTAPVLELGTGGFTFDLFVRPDALGTTQTILAKIPSGDPYTGPGYALAMNADGTLTFTMVDDTLASATGTSAEALEVGTWSHVVVAVDRDEPAGGQIYVDGIETTFDPTAAMGSLSNTLALRFAQDGGAGIGSDLAGSLDEVGLYSRWLWPYEVEAVFDAKSSGKCKIFLELEPVTAVPTGGGTTPTLETSGDLTNDTGVSATFTFSVRGDPAGTRCGLRRSTADGPTNPVVLSHQPLQVPPGATVPVRFSMDVPTFPAASQNLQSPFACYSVTATHLETGRTFVSRGVIRPHAVEATMEQRR